MSKSKILKWIISSKDDTVESPRWTKVMKSYQLSQVYKPSHHPDTARVVLYHIFWNNHSFNLTHLERITLLNNLLYVTHLCHHKAQMGSTNTLDFLSPCLLSVRTWPRLPRCRWGLKIDVVEYKRLVPSNWYIPELLEMSSKEFKAKLSSTWTKWPYASRELHSAS